MDPLVRAFLVGMVTAAVLVTLIWVFWLLEWPH